MELANLLIGFGMLLVLASFVLVFLVIINPPDHPYKLIKKKKLY